MTWLIDYFPLLIQGAGVTVLAWLVTSVLSLLIGVVGGIITATALNFRVTSRLIQCYAVIVKGVPAYVQILIAFFVIPRLIGINLSAFVAATMALGLCSGGYMIDIIKAGIDALPRGQWDAAYVLGYSLPATLWSVIAPQAVSITLPAIIGELEKLLKSTSLLATIGVTELTRTGMNIISRELNPVPIYLSIAAFYLAISIIVMIVRAYLEKRMYRGYR